MDGCVFCDFEKIKDDILWENDNYFVKVGIGILTPGHIMLITKKHFSCFGEMSEDLDDEFNEVKEKIVNEIRKQFSEPILFEQGIHGQSVKHAHIHFVPTKNKEFVIPENVQDKVFPELKKTKVKGIKDTRDIFDREGQYLYLEEKDGWVFHIDKDIDKEFNFRREFTKINGNKEFSDWRAISEESKKKNQKWVELTKEKLKWN